MRNIVAETEDLRNQLFPLRVPQVVDLCQLSDEDVDNEIHFMSDEPDMGIDPFVLFATRMAMSHG